MIFLVEEGKEHGESPLMAGTVPYLLHYNITMQDIPKTVNIEGADTMYSFICL